MPCEVVPMPSGGAAIICSNGRRKRCACGRPAPFLCDWKVPARRSGTCDAPICDRCAISPATEKHLCPAHARAFQAWKIAHPTQAVNLQGKSI
ncbi:hypothetical protein [Sphingobium yanoikuyae]|uniref:hypothetical protein n=1 Tax=Sphingobium yanoikuyae TaxID=13690 RepID=UPI001110313D|nr:hypothetical protein [Sphingobium yanoikuyae]